MVVHVLLSIIAMSLPWRGGLIIKVIFLIANEFIIDCSSFELLFDIMRHYNHLLLLLLV